MLWFLVGIPKVYWFGREGDFSIMVMDRLGPSLEKLFQDSEKKFSLKTVIMIANQMVKKNKIIYFSKSQTKTNKQFFTKLDSSFSFKF